MESTANKKSCQGCAHLAIVIPVGWSIGVPWIEVCAHQKFPGLVGKPDQNLCEGYDQLAAKRGQRGHKCRDCPNT